MAPSYNAALPFFAYGLFRPGQIAYFQIASSVLSRSGPAFAEGALLIRDGLPILDPEGSGKVEGTILYFGENAALGAYARIAALEPDKHYRWAITTVNKESVNVLYGVSPRKGSMPFDDRVWDGWDDPLFTAALEVVQETIDSSGEFSWDLKPLFRIQMAYLLLWSSIERYLSLRYHLSDRVMRKIDCLGRESAFINALPQYISGERSIYRADRPTEKLALDPTSPSVAANYYYQVRSNITHRGKASSQDYDTLLMSARELLQIFRDVLVEAKQDAKV